MDHANPISPLLPRNRVRLLAGAATALVLVVTGLWLARKPTTKTVVSQYLSDRNIASSYRIEQMGFNHIVLRDVVLGPADNPDFRAARVDLRLGWTPYPKPISLRLVHPVLRARLDKDGLSLGSLDTLISPKTQEPITLPDLALDIDHGRLALSTPAGPLSGTIEAQGRLPDGFKAQARLTAPQLQLSPGILSGLSTTVEMTTRLRQVHLQVNGAAGNASWGKITTLRGLTFSGFGSAPESVKSFKARLSLAAEDVMGGRLSARQAQLTVKAQGTPDAMSGDWSTWVGPVRAPHGQAQRISGAGNFHLALTPALAASADGRLRLEGGDVSRLSDQLLASLSSLDKTPLAPLWQQARSSLHQASRQFSLTLPLEVQWRNASGKVRIANGALQAANGTQLSMSGGRGIEAQLEPSALSAQTKIALSGPGLPITQLDVMQLDVQATRPMRLKGQMILTHWRARSSELAIPSLSFDLADQNLTTRGSLTVSGSLAGGQITGLSLPLDATVHWQKGISLILDKPCTPLSLRALDLPSFQLKATSLPLCSESGRPLFMLDPTQRLRGELTIPALKLTGKLTSSPSAFTASLGSSRIALGGTSKTPTLAATLTAAKATVALPESRLLEAHFDRLGASASLSDAGWRAQGTFTGGALKEKSLAIGLDRVGAAWSLAPSGQVIFSRGSARLTDGAARPHFQPLVIDGVTAALKNGLLTSSGSVHLVTRPQTLARYTLHHNLASASGRADITVPTLTFSPEFDISELSSLALGVVANARGSIEGDAFFSWSPQSVQSGGKLTARDLNIATGALGPINGINGTIHLNDLLALTSPPGQTLTVAQLNPGIALNEGKISFQLLGMSSVKLEHARWPLADGFLSIDSTIFSPLAPEVRVNMGVKDVDLAKFIQLMEFKNLNAIGRIDGVFPLVFSGSGGRIENGFLRTQPGGGILQYVGKVGENVKGAGGLAFDALKSFKYQDIIVDLNGDLAGEIVTSIRFTGTNQAPVNPVGSLGGIKARATGLPFKFNVTVKAPLRQLLHSATTFSDARSLILEGSPIDAQAVPGVAPEAPQSPPKP